MAQYILAGAADDVAYAEAERVCDLLVAMLPDCTVVKHRKHPSEWPAFAKRLQEVLGCVRLRRGWRLLCRYAHSGDHICWLNMRSVASVTSPMIWTGCGRVVGGAHAFLVHAFKRYGVLCDAPRKQLERFAKVNLAESVVDMERSKVRGCAGACVLAPLPSHQACVCGAGGPAATWQASTDRSGCTGVL